MLWHSPNFLEELNDLRCLQVAVAKERFAHRLERGVHAPPGLRAATSPIDNSHLRLNASILQPRERATATATATASGKLAVTGLRCHFPSMR
jgi:hypothetical protein